MEPSGGIGRRGIGTGSGIVRKTMIRMPRGTSNVNYERLLNSTSRFPYRIGAEITEETINVARARAVRFM